MVHLDTNHRRHLFLQRERQGRPWVVKDKYFAELLAENSMVELMTENSVVELMTENSMAELLAENSIVVQARNIYSDMSCSLHSPCSVNIVLFDT